MLQCAREPAQVSVILTATKHCDPMNAHHMSRSQYAEVNAIMQVADARRVSEDLQGRAVLASRLLSVSQQQSSEAGSNFMAMADSLMEASCALPAAISRLSSFISQGKQALTDAQAVIQEIKAIVKVEDCNNPPLPSNKTMQHPAQTRDAGNVLQLLLKPRSPVSSSQIHIARAIVLS